MLVGADRGGVDVDVPVDLSRGVGDGLDTLQQSLPGAVGRPQHVPTMDGLPRAEAFRQLAPLTPGAEPVNDPVDHLPVITPPTTPVVACRQQRLQHRPLVIGEIPLLSMTRTTSH